MSATITTEAGANDLPHRTIIRDNNGDAMQKFGNGWEMTGEPGRWGPSWIAYPATVLWEGATFSEPPVSESTEP